MDTQDDWIGLNARAQKIIMDNIYKYVNMNNSILFEISPLDVLGVYSVSVSRDS